jgi:hypothetical protein
MQPYATPHSCETAEVAAALAALRPRQRRALREYVWRVALGELSVTDWLRREDCPVSARAWYAKGERAGYLHSEAFQAALEAYRTAGQRWQLADEAKHITRAHATLVRATPKAAERIVEAAQADMSALFKTAERWTEWPLPSQEILDEKCGCDEDGNPIKLFLVRYACLDLDKLTDPAYARHVKKFGDSPKNGLSIELYDAQRASESILDRAGKDTANKAPSAGVLVVLPDNGRDTDPAPGGAPDGLSADAG